MISLAAARPLIAEKISPLPAQPAALAMALARVLRADIRAGEDLPAFDRSAMDGYAIALDDDSKSFRIAGEVQPGAVPQLKINRGECARIFTGAQIPEGATQVIMQESVRVESGFMTPQQRNRATNIRRRGEDARQGDLLLPTGTRLGMGELALLASLGVVQPQVSPLVRVAHFATGNELIAPAQSPQPGEIRDSNSTLVAAFVRQFGGEITRQERAADDFALLHQRVHAAENNFDLLLVSGGASVGDYDFGKKLLDVLGFQIHFEKINLRPGKPLIFATRANQAAFILPGNPVSHFVVFHVAVRLALELFASMAASWPLAQVQLVDKFDYRPDPRETYWPARVVLEQGKLVARAVRWQSSGDVTGMAGANALLQFTSATQTLEAGSVVNALLLNVP